jgi:murein DD-endopeptidase MepM/ murein hydrolase activator NlpD
VTSSYLASEEGLRYVAVACILAALGLLALIAVLPLPSAGSRPEDAREQSAGMAAGAPAGVPGSPDASTGSVARTAERLLDDSELVYGPAVQGFDSAAFLAARGGALAETAERLAGDLWSAGAVIDDVARDHSISPRLLLALLAMGITDPPPTDAAAGPGGSPAAGSDDLAARLNAAAAWLDDGYYGLKYRGTEEVTFVNGDRRRGPAEGGAAHFAVARLLALQAQPEDWPGLLESFALTYGDLFGDMPATARSPIPAGGLVQPPLLLPWPDGERWHFTGGPHGGWGVATAWAAVDFAPPSPVGCRAAPEWVVAAAPGVVARSAEGVVVQDLDGDGFEGSGWSLLYLHIAGEGRVPVGTVLAAGDAIGHPSCEGGRATGAHVHFARRYNGEWLPAAGGPVPLDISGWTFDGGEREYDGRMAHRDHGTRMAVTSRSSGPTDVVSDNGPGRHAALAEAWAAGPARLPAAPVALPAAAVGGSGGRLSLHLLLEGRASHETAIILGLSTGRRDPDVVLMGRTDAAGNSGPLALPASVSGSYTLTVRAPGFLVAQAIDVGLGSQDASVDLAMGGLAPLQPGELTGDDAITVADLAAWTTRWARRDRAADLNGDGRASLADGRLLLVNLGQAATVSGAP